MLFPFPYFCKGENMEFVHNFWISYLTAVPATLILGYLADLIFGDPHGLWHPVCLIGNIISKLEKRLLHCPDSSGMESLKEPDADGADIESGKDLKKRGRREFVGGLWLVVLTLLCTTALSMGVLLAAYRVHWGVGFAVQAWMCYTILAVKSLKTESMKVSRALETEGLEAGRKAVSMIVGRDTQRLDETGVVKAAVETVAENTSDGVIAPMFYLAIGGPILGFFYKAVNTMDSMVGYKNEKYRHFGTAAARFDDIVNFLPARISALLMIAAAFLMRMHPRNAARIWKRDRRNHASPNSAQTEAVMAGALGVELAGDAWYFGERHAKPTIGDSIRPVERQDIARANRLLYATALLGMVIFCSVRIFV